jgi:hypothetical protein
VVTRKKKLAHRSPALVAFSVVREHMGSISSGFLLIGNPCSVAVCGVSTKTISERLKAGRCGKELKWCRITSVPDNKNANNIV